MLTGETKNSLELFGFIVYFDNCTLHIDASANSVSAITENGYCKKVTLRDTSMRLLIYMLKNSNGKVINNKELLLNVWDVYNLKSSNQRLNQVMMTLINKLYTLGVPPGFIKHHLRAGYAINSCRAVVLYSRAINDETTRDTSPIANKKVLV